MRSLAVLLLMTPAISLAADVDPFTTAGSMADGQGTLQAESPFLIGNGLSGSLNMGFAENLAMQQFADGSESPAVAGLMGLSLQGSWTLSSQKARFDLFLPTYPYADAPLTGYAGAAMGDLRAQSVIPVIRRSKAFGLALVPRVELPTGTQDAVVRRGFTAGLTAAAGGQFGDYPVHWVANLGVAGAPSDELTTATLGSSFDSVAGVYWDIHPTFRVGGEVDLSQQLTQSVQGSITRSSSHLFAQQSLPSGFALSAGAGGGLIGGVGAPEYRVIAALTWSAAKADRDLDSIVDAQDACPTSPEDLDAFQDDDGCPDLDNDQDTVLDVDDLCALAQEDLDGFEDGDGCPDEDNDQDGVVDIDDRCPLDAGSPLAEGCPDRDSDGVADMGDLCPDDPGIKEMSGCPDSDLDGFADADDACPMQPGVAPDGCPAQDLSVGKALKLDDRIQFETGKATLKASASAILTKVATLLQRHPEVKKVEVAGHTDSQGAASTNERLSKARANSVRTWLIDNGVEAQRLVAKGYGEAKPIASNRLESGREANRRVEFVILSRDESLVKAAPEPASPWGQAEAPASGDDAAATTTENPWGEATKPSAPTESSESPWGEATPPQAAEPAATDSPWGEATKPAEPEGSDDANPWGAVIAPPPAEADTTPKSKSSALLATTIDTTSMAANPWADALDDAVAEPAGVAAPEPAAAAPAATSDDANPWGAVVAPPPTGSAEEATPETEPAPPPVPADMDPDGPPGSLTVKIRGGAWGNVYLDDQRLTRGAPFENFPIKAGKHTIWVANSRAGIDWTTEIEVKNGQAVKLIVPGAGEDELPAEPEPSAPAENPWGATLEQDDASPWGSTEAADDGNPWGSTESGETSAPAPSPEPEPESSKRPPRKSKKR